MDLKLSEIQNYNFELCRAYEKFEKIARESLHLQKEINLYGFFNVAYKHFEEVYKIVKKREDKLFPVI